MQVGKLVWFFLPLLNLLSENFSAGWAIEDGKVPTSVGFFGDGGVWNEPLLCPLSWAQPLCVPGPIDCCLCGGRTLTFHAITAITVVARATTRAGFPLQSCPFLCQSPLFIWMCPSSDVSVCGTFRYVYVLSRESFVEL